MRQEVQNRDCPGKSNALVVFRLGMCGWVKLHLQVSVNHRWLGPRKEMALAKRKGGPCESAPGCSLAQPTLLSSCGKLTKIKGERACHLLRALSSSCVPSATEGPMDPGSSSRPSSPCAHSAQLFLPLCRWRNGGLRGGRTLFRVIEQVCRLKTG